MNTNNLIFLFLFASPIWSCQKSGVLDSERKDSKSNQEVVMELMSLAGLTADIQHLMDTDFDGEILLHCNRNYGNIVSNVDANVSGSMLNASRTGSIPMGDLDLGGITVPEASGIYNKVVDIASILGQTILIEVKEPTGTGNMVDFNLYLPEELVGTPPTDFSTNHRITWNADNNNNLGVVIRYVFGTDVVTAAQSEDYHWIYESSDNGSYTFTSSDLSKASTSDAVIKYTVIRGNYDTKPFASDPNTEVAFGLIHTLTGYSRL